MGWCEVMRCVSCDFFAHTQLRRCFRCHDVELRANGGSAGSLWGQHRNIHRQPHSTNCYQFPGYNLAEKNLCEKMEIERERRDERKEVFVTIELLN